MRLLRTLIISLTVVFLASVSPATAESTVRDEVASTVAPASERMAALIQPESGDKTQCTFIRNQISKTVVKRALNVERFVDDLFAQIAERPAASIVLQAEFVDTMSLTEAIESGNSNAKVTAVGVYFAGLTISIPSTPVDSLEEHIERIQRQMDSSVVSGENYLDHRKSGLDEAKQGGNAKQILRAEKRVSRAERKLAGLVEARDEFTQDSIVVHGVQIEGTPGAILASLGSERVYMARLLTNPVHLPSVIAQVMEANGMNEADATQWIKGHRKAAKALRGNVSTPISNKSLKKAEKACKQ